MTEGWHAQQCEPPREGIVAPTHHHAVPPELRAVCHQLPEPASTRACAEPEDAVQASSPQHAANVRREERGANATELTVSTSPNIQVACTETTRSSEVVAPDVICELGGAPLQGERIVGSSSGTNLADHQGLSAVDPSVPDATSHRKVEDVGHTTSCPLEAATSEILQLLSDGRLPLAQAQVVERELSEFITDATQESVALPPALNANQRRAIKARIEQNTGFTCESFGFGGERSLHIFRESQRPPLSGIAFAFAQARTGDVPSTGCDTTLSLQGSSSVSEITCAPDVGGRVPFLHTGGSLESLRTEFHSQQQQQEQLEQEQQQEEQQLSSQNMPEVMPPTVPQLVQALSQRAPAVAPDTAFKAGRALERGQLFVHRQALAAV